MTKPAPKPTLAMDVAVNAPCWDAEPAAEDIVRRAIGEAARTIGAQGALTLVLTDDTEIRALNSEWRGVDKPTNVLSFPAAPSPGGPQSLGDIIVAYEAVKREAADEGKAFADHLSHLAVHGFLHLLGYDHDTDAKADVMEGLERKVLAALGVADPYGEGA